MTHVWLENPETGGKAQFSIESLEYWHGHGWVDTDPAPEPDLTKDPVVDEPTDKSADESTAEAGSENGEQDQESTTRSGRRKRGQAAEE